MKPCEVCAAPATRELVTVRSHLTLCEDCANHWFALRLEPTPPLAAGGEHEQQPPAP